MSTTCCLLALEVILLHLLGCKSKLLHDMHSRGVTSLCSPGDLLTTDLLTTGQSVQTTALDNTHAEHRSLQTKLEALEQRQSAAAQLASEAAHSHSLQVKQLEMLVEEHQRRMQSALSKTELRNREAAEQIADRTVAEAQAALQVCVFALFAPDTQLQVFCGCTPFWCNTSCLQHATDASSRFYTADVSSKYFFRCVLHWQG